MLCSVLLGLSGSLLAEVPSLEIVDDGDMIDQFATNEAVCSGHALTYVHHNIFFVLDYRAEMRVTLTPTRRLHLVNLCEC